MELITVLISLTYFKCRCIPLYTPEYFESSENGNNVSGYSYLEEEFHTKEMDIKRGEMSDGYEFKTNFNLIGDHSLLHQQTSLGDSQKNIFNTLPVQYSKRIIPERVLEDQTSIANPKNIRQPFESSVRKDQEPSFERFARILRNVNCVPAKAEFIHQNSDKIVQIFSNSSDIDEFNEGDLMMIELDSAKMDLINDVCKSYKNQSRINKRSFRKTFLTEWSYKIQLIETSLYYRTMLLMMFCVTVLFVIVYILGLMMA